ncbi:YaiI/YqxD family protein [Desulfitobacterium metallireducens]|uniref:UPF0178 protein DESME_08345 n=1 Tax=Desulfitobacterium metallireducens DSM 15288 TaxID=871968 RepID=W0EDC4_9FIRM|nr:DUF188 domain-containing protein [Desulfitobacterium metallireducens]AHF07081.1 hypothetical protein DESME_08345 [Desulfitobacterium metallireducens DSM 15288]
MKIIVDADACPQSALQICFKLGKLHQIEVWTVASFDHRILSEHHITVGDNSQEADLKILNVAKAWDIIITQDFGLAAMVLGKGAYAMGPKGVEYRPETIDFLLEEREIKAKYRRAGGRTKGPKKRTEEDDHAFKQGLTRLIEMALKSSP